MPVPAPVTIAILGDELMMMALPTLGPNPPSAVVLERQLNARAIGDDLAAFHFHVELRHFRDAEIAQRLAGGRHGILGRILPRHPARADDFGHAIDAAVAGTFFCCHGISSWK